MGSSRSGKKPSDPEYVVVYSTEEKRCPGCHRAFGECSCSKALLLQCKFKVQIEKKGRGGKTVTVISNLPAREQLLKDLTSHLKRSIGGGGTSYIEAGEGFIEIQGEHRDRVVELISAYRSKG
jgi:translation initiation factor 1